MSNNLSQFITKNRGETKVLDELSTDARMLFEFLVLVVDIRQRAATKVIEEEKAQGYNTEVQSNKVLADQISSVDNGLQGYVLTEVI